jgi:hypothetical protein
MNAPIKSFDVVLLAGYNPTNLLKLSTITTMKENPFSSSGRGPKESTDRDANGSK